MSKWCSILSYPESQRTAHSLKAASDERVQMKRTLKGSLRLPTRLPIPGSTKRRGRGARLTIVQPLLNKRPKTTGRATHKTHKTLMWGCFCGENTGAINTGNHLLYVRILDQLLISKIKFKRTRYTAKSKLLLSARVVHIHLANGSLPGAVLWTALSPQVAHGDKTSTPKPVS